MKNNPNNIISGRKSIIKRSSIRREICVVSDQGPVVVPKLVAVPLAVLVVVQTRPQVGCGPDLPLPVDEGMESLDDDDGLDVFFSGRESTMNISDVSHDLCVEPDQCPVVVHKLAAVPLAIPVVVQTRPQVGCGPDLPLPMDEGMESLDDDGSPPCHDVCVEPDQCPLVVPKEARESLALPVVALTRSQAGCALVCTWPVNDNMISQVGVGPDLLSGRVMTMVDPDIATR